MDKNLGLFDRIIRGIIGILFVAIYFEDVVSVTLGVILLLLGIVILLTSLFSYCPVYSLLGFTTKSRRERGNKQG